MPTHTHTPCRKQVPTCCTTATFPHTHINTCVTLCSHACGCGRSVGTCYITVAADDRLRPNNIHKSCCVVQTVNFSRRRRIITDVDREYVDLLLSMPIMHNAVKVSRVYFIFIIRFSHQLFSIQSIFPLKITRYVVSE